MSTGFFVPKSISESFVANKKTAEGTNQWGKASSEVGLEKQAALQTLNKQYSSTINDAYSNYLLASRGIRGSDMGEGYKEAYFEATQKELASKAAEANLGAATARQEIEQGASKQLLSVQEAYDTEVANMDRVYGSANDYLSYLRTLTNKTDMTTPYLSTDQMSGLESRALTIDDMYDTVWQAQPVDYLDEEGNIALSYIEWVNTQLKGTDADKSWIKWFLQGGFDQAKAGSKTIKKTTSTPTVPTAPTAPTPAASSNSGGGGGGRSR